MFCKYRRIQCRRVSLYKWVFSYKPAESYNDSGKFKSTKW